MENEREGNDNNFDTKMENNENPQEIEGNENITDTKKDNNEKQQEIKGNEKKTETKKENGQNPQGEEKKSFFKRVHEQAKNLSRKCTDKLRGSKNNENP